jgi:hypothetical protein
MDGRVKLIPGRLTGTTFPIYWIKHWLSLSRLRYADALAS